MTDEADRADPFRAARRADGVLRAEFAGEPIPMILGYRAVRAAAQDWRTFSSDAPFRVPIPSEEGVRSVRQLPIEADPPLHTAFRRLVQPVFDRPRDPAHVERIDVLVATLLDQAIAAGELEVVRDFALPMQSRALTHLLGMPEAAAEVWIGWGTHVFHDGEDGAAKGRVLDRYIRDALAAARQAPGDDLFSRLVAAEVDGRPLSEDEMAGIANLAFAGGRDTVIHAVTRTIAHFAGRRADLDAIAADPTRTALAVEELLRVVSPLTHIGRVCPEGAAVGGEAVTPGRRVSLCWASANRDETVFDDPDAVRLDRSPNPHVAFGSGVHTCLGALHARTLLRSLVRQLAERVDAIEIRSERRQYEVHPAFTRWVGYETLVVRMTRGAR